MWTQIDWSQFIPSSDTYKNIIAPSLSPLFVVAGWRIVSRDNDKRETRKELKAAVNEFTKGIDELEGSVTTYFREINNEATPDDARLAEAKIKRSLERMELQLEVINNIQPGFGCQRELDNLNNVITAHPKWEARLGPVLSVSDRFFLSLALACTTLTRELNTSFITKHVPQASVRRFFSKSAATDRSGSR